MKIKKNIALVALAITLFLFTSILTLGMLLNTSREAYLNDEFQKLYHDFNSLQTLTLIEDYGDDLVCIAFEEKMLDMDSYIWDLGEKIDKYRVATEEFNKDKYYISQKKIFNQNEVLYYLMMKKMVDRCEIVKEPILFFYQNSEDCKKCDDQSFVLSDINEVDDTDGENEIAIFSFDMDLNISSIKVLTRYYGSTWGEPCVVFSDDYKLCGMMDKEIILKKLCSLRPELSVCEIEGVVV